MERVQRSLHRSTLAKRLVEVRDDVVDVLDPDREADEVVRDAGGELLRRGELLVRRGRRVDHEALRVADVREVGEELRLSMNFFPAATPPLMPKPRIAPYNPRWWYLFARACEGWLGSPGS